MSKPFLILLFMIAGTLRGKCQQVKFADSAEIFMPNLVSTKNSDVKVTFSPDGKKMLWGGIDWIAGKKDQDIWQSDKVKGGWTKSVRVSFDTDSDEFDPFFAPDGKRVYFYSNRMGGYGGDDIYYVPYDRSSNKFGSAVNLGATINTPGDEWAPVTDAAGKKLLFSSNGHGGYGGQDLFFAKILLSSFAQPVNLGPVVNGSNDDFDATILPGDILVYTSNRGKNQKAELYLSYKKNNQFSSPEKLPAQINGSDFWTFAPSVNFNQPGYLYFCSHLKYNIGRTDVYRIQYWLIK